MQLPIDPGPIAAIAMFLYMIMFVMISVLQPAPPSKNPFYV
jgi:hypothetical protein